MNDRSKDLLKKMCSVLKVVRQVCLISFALSIGLSLFYAFNKDVYNTLFGSIRIDYLELILMMMLLCIKIKCPCGYH